VRARNPRSSAWRSTSIRTAPSSGVGVKIIVPALPAIVVKAF
jgi:hypothetical protein